MAKKQSWKEKAKKKIMELQVKQVTEKATDKVKDVAENPKEHANTFLRKAKNTVKGFGSEIKRETDKSFAVQSVFGTVKGAAKAVKSRSDQYMEQIENRANANAEDHFAHTVVNSKRSLDKTLHGLVNLYGQAKQAASKTVTNEHIIPGYNTLLNIIEEETQIPGVFTKEYARKGVDYIVEKKEISKAIGKNSYSLKIETAREDEDEKVRVLNTAKVFMSYKTGTAKDNTRLLAKVSQNAEAILDDIDKNTKTYRTAETITITLNETETATYDRKVTFENNKLEITYTPKQKNGVEIYISKEPQSKEEITKEE